MFAIKHGNTYLTDVLDGGNTGKAWCFETLTEAIANKTSPIAFDSIEAAQREAKQISQTYSEPHRSEWTAKVEIVESAEVQMPVLPPALQEAIEQLSRPIVSVLRQEFALYLVHTEAENPDHHGGWHTNTSPYVLTTNPSPGDRIAYKLTGQKSIESEGYRDGSWSQVGGSAWLSLHSKKADSRERVLLKIPSHPGRGPVLGEDGLEDAYGHDIVAVLWLEKLNGLHWQYAPCDVQQIDEPADDEPNELRAKWHSEHGWQLDNE